ncbi:MlaD family protein [Mycolicibacterium pulveris]|uniref:MlaD family protein n=1 Tax=Mycolicibacterium pulveris TaxID=36813 RepID=UPI003CF7B00C
MKLLRSPTVWGIGALAFATVVALVVALLYISPPGRSVVTFYTEDSASIRIGDQVRIAGITVGNVKELALEEDKVRVRARVDDDAFVGDRSQIQVRMLTVVGGYYVDLISLGDVPLGDEPIPLERVTMPYNLMQTLADSRKITENVTADPINESLDQVQSALRGDNVNALSAMIDAGNSIMETVDKQRGQVSAILNLSDEYIAALSGFSDGLRELVRKASIVEQTLVLYGARFASSLKGIADVFDALAPVGLMYQNNRDDFLEKVRHYQETARYWVERNGAVIRGLRLIRRKIERVLDAETAPPELLATDVCMPIPGGPC